MDGIGECAPLFPDQPAGGGGHGFGFLLAKFRRPPLEKNLLHRRVPKRQPTQNNAREQNRQKQKDEALLHEWEQGKGKQPMNTAGAAELQ